MHTDPQTFRTKVWMITALLMWVVAFAGVAAKGAGEPPGPPAASENSSPPGKSPHLGSDPSVPLDQAAQAKTPAKPTVQAAQGQAYVGTAKCLECHEQSIQGSMHARAEDPRTPSAKQGCESCHGPGSKHAEDPTSFPVLAFTRATADDVNTACATCHNRGEHALWDGSQHENRGLSCASCHSVHTPKSEMGQLKAKDQLTLCATCHRDKVAKLDRSGHMPVREGKMQCSTCHNTHGSTNVRLLRKGDSIAEACTSCHAEKRGPFLWEHAPSRDGCITCHDPHGSSNERMLVAKPPILCQRCHVMTRHPSTIYDQALVGSGASPSVRIFARSCVTCHSAIHGSNHPSGQRFIR
jgi:DmsE family decaheme c-type cytochrome